MVFAAHLMALARGAAVGTEVLALDGPVGVAGSARLCISHGRCLCAVYLYSILAALSAAAIQRARVPQRRASAL